MDSTTSRQLLTPVDGRTGDGNPAGMSQSGAPQGARRPAGLSSAHREPEAKEREKKKEGIEFAKGGSVGRVCFSGCKRVRVGGGIRGKITEFSRGSRRRMLAYVNSIDREQVSAERVWFVTLTLPGQEPSHNPEDWQRWLAALKKRIQRKWGRFPIVWKLEFQARGAAHWHLLAVIKPEMVSQLREFRAWLATAWYEVVGSLQETHRKAGTQVDPVRTWGGVISYAGKYLGKEVPQIVNPETGEVITPGRFWGVWHKDLVPIEWVAVAMAREALFQVRRVIRRYTGRPPQGRLWTFHAYAPSHMWERLAAWARGAPTTPTVATPLLIGTGSA